MKEYLFNYIIKQNKVLLFVSSWVADQLLIDKEFSIDNWDKNQISLLVMEQKKIIKKLSKLSKTVNFVTNIIIEDALLPGLRFKTKTLEIFNCIDENTMVKDAKNSVEQTISEQLTNSTSFEIVNVFAQLYRLKIDDKLTKSYLSYPKNKIGKALQTNFAYAYLTKENELLNYLKFTFSKNNININSIITENQALLGSKGNQNSKNELFVKYDYSTVFLAANFNNKIYASRNFKHSLERQLDLLKNKYKLSNDQLEMYLSTFEKVKEVVSQDLIKNDVIMIEIQEILTKFFDAINNEIAKFMDSIDYKIHVIKQFGFSRIALKNVLVANFPECSIQSLIIDNNNYINELVNGLISLNNYQSQNKNLNDTLSNTLEIKNNSFWKRLFDQNKNMKAVNNGK
ncbi:MAG3720 family protein [Mycoplasmopsis opalescens]|uniref:MAG3720 family protein n=1 Tax=Mycoplasmopsis opalescens TaxID=114886 RepID=UPI0004A77D47|nr:hypothetical protein [Mycoplasmopsis opalescens]